MSACTDFAAAIENVALGAPPNRALTAHLTTCAACAAQLERQRSLAQRIDRAIGIALRAEPSAELPARIGARISLQRPQRWGPVWLVPASVALAAGLLFFISVLDGRQRTMHVTDIGALFDWRSPTASLLISRNSVLTTPFTLRGLRDGLTHSRS